MSTRFLSVAFFLAFLTPGLYSQIYFLDHGSTSDSIEMIRMINKGWNVHDSLYKSKGTIESMEIFEVRGKKYMLADGRFDVFEWRNGNWVNLYKFFHHGYNYSGYKFVFNDEIYSFGGYGFWRKHGELVKFLWDRNEWEIVTYNNDKPEGFGYTYYSDGNLYVIDPISYNETKNISINKGKSFRLDLKTLKKSDFDISFNYSHGAIFETKNYLLFLSKPTCLINKRKQALSFNNLTCFEGIKNLDFRKKMFFHTRNDLVSVYDRNMRLILKFDIESELKGFEPVRSKSLNYYFLIPGIVIFLISASGLVYFKRKKTKSSINKSKTDKFGHPLIEKFMALSGQTITVEELDVILGIENILHAETQRYKRSKIINAINQETSMKTGKELIHRIPDPEDKRRFLYEVNGLK